MDNILFIGGAGFIGSNIIAELVKNTGYKIYVIEPALANVSGIEHLPVEILKGSISDIDMVETVLKANNIKKVVHLVSTMVPGCGYEEYKQEFEKVMFPTVRLMQYCSRNEIQFIYFSSGGTVYGERKTLKPFKEDDPKEPISYYGLSKQMIENSILFEHRTSGLQYLIIRPSNPYGHGQNLHGRQGLIAVALGKILSGEPITIWGDGGSVRDYIYIEDLAHIVAELLYENISNKTINIGSSKGYSVKEVIDIITEVVEEDLKVEYTLSRKNDVSNMILDTTLMKSMIDIDLTPLKDGIKKFYEEEKEKIKNE